MAEYSPELLALVQKMMHHGINDPASADMVLKLAQKDPVLVDTANGWKPTDNPPTSFTNHPGNEALYQQELSKAIGAPEGNKMTVAELWALKNQQQNQPQAMAALVEE